MAEETKKEVLTETFPANRKTERKSLKTESRREKKVQAPVVKGKVRKQKRGFGKKMTEVLLEDDTKSVGGYILYDILIPAAKELINDMIGGGVEMLLFGEQRRGQRRSSRSNRQNSRGSYVNYGSFSSGRTRDSRDEGRQISRAGRARHDFDEVVLDTRGEAEEVLGLLVDLTIDYDEASVADFYDLVGIESNFTDDKYGWVDLRGVTISRARGGGYLIDLPRPKLLD